MLILQEYIRGTERKYDTEIEMDSSVANKKKYHIDHPMPAKSQIVTIADQQDNAVGWAPGSASAPAPGSRCGRRRRRRTPRRPSGIGPQRGRGGGGGLGGPPG